MKINIASLDNEAALNAPIKISGYPAEIAGKTTYAQYEMSGTISSYTAYRYYYTIDTSGGQSGSPILDKNNVAIGIHTSLEKNENGEWVKVDYVEDYYFDEIGIIINNLQTTTLKINVLDAFGKTLDEGEYRFTKEFSTGINSSVTFNVNVA